MEVSETEKIAEDRSRLSAWLSRLGLSSQLAEYTSLLRSINPLSKSDSETAHPSSTSVSISGADDVPEVASQEFRTRQSLVPRVLPHVGLNTVMSMKKDSKVTRPLSHRCLWNSCSTMSSGSKESVTVSPSGTQSRVSGRTSGDLEEKSSSSMSTVDSSPRLFAPATVSFGAVMQDLHSMFDPIVTAATEARSGHCFSTVSTESTCDLLKLAAVPSVVVSPDVESVFRPALATAVETDDGFCDKTASTPGTSSPTSAFGEGRKTSTPAKRPQSLDVIPWSPLSQSACKLTGSLSTVVHSHVSASSSTSAATKLIPASPVNIPAV